MPSQAAINALNLIDDAPDDARVKRILVNENRRLSAQVTYYQELEKQMVKKIDELLQVVASKQHEIDALKFFIEVSA